VKSLPLLLASFALASGGLAADRFTQLESGFASPPPAARPWVYWFWLNGNVTSNGITADLEAMKRVGVGGVLIMEVDQGAPKGPAAFGQPPWRQLFKHVCAEAGRLGLEVNMNNDAGWCGSGGPWISPELAMQKVVWTETNLAGPAHFDATLPQPKSEANYYQDIAVFAFPTPAGNARLEGIQGKAAFSPTFIAPQASFATVPPDQAVARDRLVELTSRLEANGHLNWEVPPGPWTIVRFGHTPTGKDNHPAPEPGRGLECDKLSRPAADAMFNGLMGNLVTDSQPLVGKALVATHIDSWEVGSQNWTPRLREEFQRRRGYDLWPFLPALTGRIVEGTEISERFLWDLRQTISELVLENYAGYFRELAHRHGLRLSIEAYSTCPVDELAYAGRADEPMGEFWSWAKYGMAFSCTEMTSAAHVYGKPIVGAEAFTASDQEKWLGYPGNIKDLGDWAFCEGINRFVFHRYALQPWPQNVQPGMSMGPWGLHYERTETWWDQSKAWHEYLARCQFLLQQGLFVADLCLLTPEGSPQTIERQSAFLSHAPGLEGQPLDRPGHNFDLCPPEAVLTRMSVKDGRLVLPDGMSYRLLALPQVETMTPQLLRKIRDLVRAGATVAGSRPLKSPSLSDYPACDAEVKALADELWGAEPARSEVAERRLGQGRVISGTRFEQGLPKGPAPSRLAGAQWIWFQEGNPRVAAPVGARYFRRTFEAAPGVDSARLVLTVDNSFECWVNGQPAGAGDDFTRLYTRNIAKLLRPGTNLLAIKAVNGAEQPNPAGLIGALTIHYHDGRTVTLPTDRTWLSAVSAPDAWRTNLASLAAWQPSLELGPPGVEPWGDLERTGAGTDLYPDLEFLGQLLDERGLKPDFAYTTSDGSRSLRYIHKRLEGAEVYFVANKLPESQQAVCAFRVRRLRPEFWQPETGRLERPLVYDLAGDCVRVPLRLEPNGSVFVVFHAKAETDRVVSVTRRESAGSNRPAALGPGGLQLWRERGESKALVWQPGQYAYETAKGAQRQFSVAALPAAVTLAGPWTVTFPDGSGAPATVAFDKLMSWSERPEPGVKFFSGTATYKKTFALPAGLAVPGRRLFLDLGKVAVMSEVTLNGHELGTLWKPPYRLEITDVLKAVDNSLEVRVVNLWVNRQIGDEQLPEDSSRNPNGTLKAWPAWLQEGKPSPTGRYTFTSWRLWGKDAPLQESGLLGPVQVLVAGELTLGK